MGNFNIFNALAEVAERQAGEDGLVAGQGSKWQSWTFAELEQNSSWYGRQLQQEGVGQGDRVMLMVRPSMEFICLTFALFRCGAVVILIDPGMGYKNLLRCIGSVRPDILVGIPKAILFSRLFRTPFATVEKRLAVGGGLSWADATLAEPLEQELGVSREPIFQAAEHDLAAIIFTTGSTGPPKGVQYTHGIFHAQLELIRDYYGIGPGDVDQPGFPLFALFSTALGAKAVIPDMDPTRPAKVDPRKFIRSINEHEVSYSFGSPAIWNVVSTYCLEHDIVLPVKKILMAGAPVSGELIARVGRVMAPDGTIYTPYGATESLPIASIEGSEVVEQTWALTRKGEGTCVGRPLPGICIRIIDPVDGPLVTWDTARELGVGEIGEIVVQGPVVTRAYDNNDLENQNSKITDKNSFWHRMGDMGFFDEQGRLWFCGRKAHRVFSKQGVMYTIPSEAVFNEHPKVLRSALVGVGPEKAQIPVLIVELVAKMKVGDTFYGELRQLAKANSLTEHIDTFLVHRSFPVDIRHNAKIFREKLARWAGKRLKIKPG